MGRNLQHMIADDPGAFLDFLKSKFLVFHDSNVFFRDLHYGVMDFLRRHNIDCSYAEAERATHAVVRALESRGIFRKIDDRTWMLNYPDFRATPRKPAAPEKPSPAPRPSSAAAPPAAGVSA